VLRESSRKLNLTRDILWIDRDGVKQGFEVINRHKTVYLLGHPRSSQFISGELSQYNDFAMPITRSKSASRKKSSPATGRSGLARATQPASGASQRARPASRKSPPPPPTSLFENISPEHKMDILGVVMALVGLITLLSLFSAGKGSLTGAWINALQTVFGWGVYILPVGLIVLGTWLVARNVDRLPELSLERIVGIILLFLALLATFTG